MSALEFDRPGSTPVLVFEKAVNEDTLATCLEIEAEIFRILTRKFLWDERLALSSMQVILKDAIQVKLQGTVRRCRDPKDDMVLECAVRAKADLLVAGDKDLLVLGSFEGTQIVTPAQYLGLPR